MDNPQINLDDLAKLSKMLKWKKSKRYYAKRLGIAEKDINILLKELKKYRKSPSKREETTRKENFVKGTLESIKTVSNEPNNHKELALVHNVDLDKYIIVNYWSKLQTSGKFTSSIFCKRKKPQDYSLEDFEKFFKNYTPNYTPIKSPNLDSDKELVDLEVSISDYHLAKKYITELNANVYKRGETFFNIFKSLVLKAHRIYNIDNLVFPISNDFFHTDTYWNTTTNGTPQNVIAEFDKEYEVGFDILVKCIMFAQEHAKNVVVILVPGNHDRTKAFYLAHALDVFFSKEKAVTFLRDSDPIKGLKVGNTFIGYHHGNCKIEQLPLLFATDPECSEAFGKAKYREVHTGDKHHYMAKEIKGVRIQQMPSLSGTDKWHRDNNFVNNIRAALVLLYDKEKGKIGEFEERI